MMPRLDSPRSLAATVFAMIVVGLAACDPKEPLDGVEQCGSTTGGEAAVPIAVDCSFDFDGVRTDVTYAGGDGELVTPVGGKLIASGMLDDPEFDSRSFSLTIYAEDATVLSSTLYQMDRRRLPANEFFGDHGFTGLNRVNDPDAQEGVQYACFARDPGDPPHAWED